VAHRTQQNASERSRGIAKRDEVEHLTHSQTGKIRSRNSYGKDSYPSNV
jgi:hypothetical protein